MSLLNPFALIWALIIGLLLLLHFRKPKRIHYVSNLRLWQTPAAESIDRLPVLHKIKRNWRLILQIAYVAFVVLALARPSLLFWGRSRTVVLIMDCSASMGSIERGRTRIDLAREKALELLNQAGRNDHIVLVEGKAQPFLITDHASLRDALDHLAVTEDSADMERALMLGLSSIGKTEFYEAFVLSDGTQEIRFPQDNRIHYIQVGESGNNVGITRLSVRSNPFSPYDREIFAEVENFSDLKHRFRFDLSTAQSPPLISEGLELGPGQAKSFVAKVSPDARGVVRARIDVSDDLDADNRAQVVLDLEKIRVLLVTSGNQFLQKALETNPRIHCTTAGSQADLNGYDVIVLDGVVPQQLPPSNYFRIEYGSGSAARDLMSPVPHHPVLSLLNLRNIAVEEALPLKIESSETVLIVGKGMPLMTASETGRFRTVRLGFDIRSSNLPLNVSFPVLVSNVVNWLGSRSDDSASRFDGRESRIKPVFKPNSLDRRLSNKPALMRTGFEIWRPLLVIALALLVLEFMTADRRKIERINPHKSAAHKI